VRDLAALIGRLVQDSDAPTLMNVGTGTSRTLNQLIETMQSITGKPAYVSYGDARPGDIKISRADVSRLQAYEPGSFTPLEIGLKALLKCG
jgi:UDP-glucose 4-epimerase